MNNVDENIISIDDDFSPIESNDIIEIDEKENIINIDEPKEEDIIKFDDISQTDVINNLSELEKDKKIERIQIGLIIFLVVVGSLIYFFGYDLFEPYIKID